MNKRQIKAHDGFLVTNVNYFSNFDEQVLTDLYLPIIGTQAFSLYLYFWSLTQKKLVSMDRFEHTRLINGLGISLEELTIATNRLEGIGLLRTFLKEDIIGTLFLYELSAPVNPERFFKDDLLTSYLKEMVGDSSFNDLRAKYTLHPANTKKFTEITASFFDVYQFDTVSLKPSKFSLNFQAARPPTKNEFDQKLFLTLTKKFDLDEALIRHNLDNFKEVAAFYQLNELELVNSIINSRSVEQEQFKASRLTEYLNQKIKIKKPVKEKRADLTEKDKPENAQLDLNDQKILNLAQKFSPLNFLKYTKEQLGGYITNSEAAILRKLMRRQILPDAVINIMIDYELKNNPTITQHLTDTIANDWSQKQIQTPKQALIYLKNYSGRQRKSVSKPAKHQKPVPKWFDEKEPSKQQFTNSSDLNNLIKSEEQKRKSLEEKG